VSDPGAPRTPNVDPALLKAVERLLRGEQPLPNEVYERHDDSAHGTEAGQEQSYLSTPSQEGTVQDAEPGTYGWLPPGTYLVRERAAEHRTEYFDGRLVAMAGGTRIHALIAQNIAAHLYFRLGDGCSVVQSDLKVRAEGANAFMYPDVLVLCGEPQSLDRKHDVVTNPTVVFEVLSPSTEQHDRTTKAAAYRSIESLFAYVFVSQVEPRVEVYAREAGGAWECTFYRQYTDVVQLPWIGCELTLAEIYKQLLPAAVAWPASAT
jgi:Uma2 family endonuclease